MDDRRRQPRHEVKNVRAKVEAGDGASTYFEAWYTTVNISNGGLFIEGGATLDADTPLKLTLFPEHRKEPLLVAGKVAHSREEEGMGVRFIARDASLIKDLLGV